LVVEEPSTIRESLEMPMIEVSSPKARISKAVIHAIDGVESVSMYGERLHIGLKERGFADKVLAALTAHGLEVEGYREIVPSLEDVFIALVNKERERQE
jgi:ABC-2 type transport system ATP-binding protein